jgi:hypothetical protein
MARRDYFNAKLKYLTCGREGVVNLSEADGHAYARDNSTTVVAVPGFKVINRRGDEPEFSCVDFGGLIIAQ